MCVYMCFISVVKALTLPLTFQQLESTTRIQKLAPLQQTIQAKFAGDEEMKNKLLAQLFQAAQVNPLAGCFPALVQTPIFISLYRALTNLVAQNKLNEPFLWIPNLQGPVYQAPSSKAMDWIYSIFSGNPSLGWSDTLAFLSLPFILYISQTISKKVLTPRDPNKVVTEQEQFAQGLISYLPLIMALFSINVPAGLVIYWVTNNILTTLITIAIKSQIKDEPFPPEVDQVMSFVELGTPTKQTSTWTSPSTQEFRGRTVEDKTKAEGFGMMSSGDEQVGEEGESDGDDYCAELEVAGKEGDGDGMKSKKRNKASKMNRRR
ncbi:YidC/Oxa1 family membrane protein insertase [archaeon]|nr:MAG: YidC/Oxa1 family membrane protein insertase [archaeon]